VFKGFYCRNCIRQYIEKRERSGQSDYRDDKMRMFYDREVCLYCAGLGWGRYTQSIKTIDFFLCV
ncbi:hypothetical protein ONP80_16640, partial [Salmonella enterica subsp. enterica serovar Montevideo]|nr:hypothetical protein [Salmonella enterica subsp. enterica serovar Montevideo]